MRRFLGIVVVLVSLFCVHGFAAAQETPAGQAIYVPSFWDTQLLDRIDDHVDTLIDTGDKNRLTFLLSRIKEVQPSFEDDPQAGFLLYEIERILADAVSWVKKNPHLYEEQGVSQNEEKEADVKTIVENQDTQEEQSTDVDNTDMVGAHIDDDPDDGLPPIVIVPTPLQEFTRSDFLTTYEPYMKGTKPLYESCFTYYDQIDALAKKNDFPTALIIATRYREHSCFMKNPANGWGNFQITSHEYPEGPIDISVLLVQIQEFIDFSRAKWEYYDLVQKFGPEPIVLKHNLFDLSSIRKHAIFYNGVYPSVTLDKSRYSNENFTRERGGRDGIVAAMLKVLQRERDRSS